MGRSSYLQSIWQPYPAAPASQVAGEPNWIFGRFERQTAQFVLHRSGEVLRFDIPKVATVLGHRAEQTAPSISEFLDLLRTGDWIGYRPRSSNPQIQLLAPNLLQEGAPFQTRPLTPVMIEFSVFRQTLRQHFFKQAFTELATPTLVECPGTEVFLDVFSTEFSKGQTKRTLFLPTSPEIHLKKALALGAEKVFELRPCFRNGELTEKHNPEFWMLEWYRAFANLEDLKADCRELIRSLTRVETQFSEVSVAELFFQLGLELRPDTDTATLKTWCQRLGIHSEGFELWDDLFYLIFVDRIEPFLPSHQPLFVVDYPPSQAALARINERGWADRFELYWHGLELANAYFELNDPAEQLRRSQADLRLRQQIGRQPLKLDEGFFASMRSGFPPSAGIAMGVERLFMALSGVQNIHELTPFSMRD